jgi:hypothetical protein
MTDEIETLPPKADQQGDSPKSLGEGGQANTAYFYYIRVAGDGAYTMAAYELVDIANPLGDVRSVAMGLIANAEANGIDPRPHGDDFDDRDRKRRGYFIVALDGAAFTSTDPITFFCDDALFTNSKGNDGTHTFTPLAQFDVPIAGKTVSVAAYYSHAKSFHNGGGDLDQHEWEHFRISFDAKAGQAAIASSFEDSGGTNMGPPPPPPGLRFLRPQ